MMIHLNESMYQAIKETYWIELSKILAATHTAPSWLNNNLLKELLVENIFTTSNVQITTYRALMTYANLDISSLENEFFKNKNPDSNIGRNTSFKNTRKQLFKKYIPEELFNREKDKILGTATNDWDESYEETLQMFTQNSPINKKLQNKILLAYQQFNQEAKNYLKYELEIINTNLRAKILGSMKINICPYCNRQFINTYEIKDETEPKKRIIAQLDHFLPKAEFPLFALSLYNFIPICWHCNTVLKRNKIYDNLYPVNNQSNDTEIFDLSIKSIDQALGMEKIRIDLKKSKEFEEFNDVFKNLAINDFAMASIYEFHENFATDLFKLKYRVYTTNFEDYLKKTLPGLNSQLNVEEIKQIMFGYDPTEPKELLNKPLSKLAHEILDNKFQ